MRETLTDIKGEIDSSTVIVGDFNTQLTPMDRSSKQKINKETQVLNDTLDLIDIFRTSHPNAFHPNSSHPNGRCSPQRIYFLLKCTWNILQDRQYPGSQIKPQ